MKQVYLVLVMLIITSTVVGQLNNERRVLQTLDEMAAALRNNNADALDTIYATDYTSINQRGAISTKAARLSGIKTGLFKYEYFIYKDAKIRFYGNTALVNMVVKAKIRGEDEATVLATLVLAKREERWQVVSAQSTEIFK